MQLKRFQRKELCSSETRIRSGKLRGPKAEEYRRKVIDRRAETEDGETAEEMWRKLKEITVRTAEEVCGRSKYGKKPDREEWWWSGAVQDAIKRKKDARAELKLNPSDASRAHSKRANKAAKRAVAEAKASAQAELYDELESQPDVAKKESYKIAQSRREEQEDNIASPFVNSEQGQLLVDGQTVKERWKEYFEQMLNEE